MKCVLFEFEKFTEHVKLCNNIRYAISKDIEKIRYEK